MTADGQLWLTPTLIGLASIALGIGGAATQSETDRARTDG